MRLGFEREGFQPRSSREWHFKLTNGTAKALTSANVQVPPCFVAHRTVGVWAMKESGVSFAIVAL